jgi:D-alanyl-D-alanine carboxypeptidase (penicillin-binding protein 5/6)
MADPVFAAIVNLEEVTLPGSGTFSTTNQIVGREDVVGIKTGYTEEAGANLAFAARRTAAQEPIDITGIVLGQPTRPDSFTVSSALIDAVASQVQWVTVIEANTEVGLLDSAWSDPVSLVVSEGLNLLAWPGMTLETSVVLDPVKAPLDAGSQVGWLEIRLGHQERRIPIVLANDLSGAGTHWRLYRF